MARAGLIRPAWSTWAGPSLQTASFQLLSHLWERKVGLSDPLHVCPLDGQSCWQVGGGGWVRGWALPVLVSITPGTQRPGERPLQPNITQGSGAGSSLAFVPMVGGGLGMGGGSASGWSVISADPALFWALVPWAEVRTCWPPPPSTCLYTVGWVGGPSRPKSFSSFSPTARRG